MSLVRLPLREREKVKERERNKMKKEKDSISTSYQVYMHTHICYHSAFINSYSATTVSMQRHDFLHNMRQPTQFQVGAA
jgi:hypothetical protein